MKITIKYPRSFGAGAATTFVFDIVVPEGETEDETLDRVFGGFNAGSGCENPAFVKEKMRSLSVGDFVQIGESEKWWQCEPFGWAEVDAARVDEVMAMTSYNHYMDSK